MHCGTTFKGKSPDVANYFITPKDPDRTLLSLISRRTAVTKQQMVEQTRYEHTEADLTCFSSLVAGSGSMQATMQRTRALPFR